MKYILARLSWYMIILWDIKEEQILIPIEVCIIIIVLHNLPNVILKGLKLGELQLLQNDGLRDAHQPLL